MRYTVEIYRSAQKHLAKINKRDRDKIFKAIRELGANPRPKKCKKLTGREAYRIRIGDYRVIYEIYDNQLIVVVVTVGNRKDIYK